MRHEISTSSSCELWSERRLPFEPKREALVVRDRLRKFFDALSRDRERALMGICLISDLYDAHRAALGPDGIADTENARHVRDRSSRRSSSGRKRR